MNDILKAFNNKNQESSGQSVTATDDGIKRRLDVNSTIMTDGSAASGSNPVPVYLSDENIAQLQPPDTQVVYEAANARNETPFPVTEGDLFTRAGGLDVASGVYRELIFNDSNLLVQDNGANTSLTGILTQTTAINSKTPNIGYNDPVASTPMNLSNNFPGTYSYVTPAIGKELLTGGTSSTSWFDAKSYNSMTLSYTATIASGQFAIEGTNNINDATGVLLPWVVLNSVSSSASTSALSFGTTTASLLVRLTTRYVRLRTTVASTGTVTVFPLFKQLDTPNNNVFVTGGTLNTLPAILLSNTSSTDIGAATITSSPANVNATLTNIGSFSLAYNVTAISGSGAFVDLQIWESQDGTNYNPIYHFPRITAIGNYTSPTLKLTGGFIQYRRTVGGSSPSITQNLTRFSKQVEGKVIRNFFERGLTGNATANGTTYNVEGCKTLNFSQSSAAGATVAPVFTCEGSDDGINFYNVGTLTATASTNSYIQVEVTFKFARFRCSTAGTSAVINYLNIRGQE